MIQEKAAQRNAQRRAAFQLRARRLVPNADMWIFIDETHKGRLEARLRKAWAPRGQNNDISAHFCPNGAVRYTMLAAADINGFVLGACDVVERERGDNDTNPFRGTVDTERFLKWVEGRLVPLLGRVSALEPRSVVLADNAPTHTDPRFEEMVRGAGALLLFLPPYSPDFNPIELAFHQCVGESWPGCAAARTLSTRRTHRLARGTRRYKACLRRNAKLCRESWRRAHVLALYAVTRKNMVRYERRVGFVNGLEGEEEEEGGRRRRRRATARRRRSSSRVGGASPAKAAKAGGGGLEYASC